MSSTTVRYVDHTYRDYSRYLEEGGQLAKHKKCQANFPAKLHKILSEQAHSHIITWLPHGRAFKVLNKDLLSSVVFPKYFSFKKFESFSRQLNGWGFKRLYQPGSDMGAYYHQGFLRGLPALTVSVRRLPPNQGKATPYPEGEPNFYKITEKYPLPANTSAKASTLSAATTRDRSQNVIHPVSFSVQESLAGLVTASLAASSLTVPSHGHPHESQTQEHTATSSTPNHAHSHVIQRPSSSSSNSILRHSTAYLPSYLLSQNTRGHQYLQPAPYPTNFPLTNNHDRPGQYYITQNGQPPQYQLSSPYLYQLYQAQQFQAPANVAAIERNLSQFTSSHGFGSPRPNTEAKDDTGSPTGHKTN